MSAKGYGIHDTKNWTDFKVVDFELKKEDDDDVDIKISHCGVCGSDVHVSNPHLRRGRMEWTGGMIASYVDDVVRPTVECRATPPPPPGERTELALCLIVRPSADSLPYSPLLH